jgi:integrase
MRSLFRLSPTTIHALALGRHADGGGLYLHVRPTGKNWVFRYRRRAGVNSEGKPFALRDMGLGTLADTTLAEARKKRDRAYAVLRSDALDPLKDKATKVKVANDARTFGDYVDEFLDGPKDKTGVRQGGALAGLKNAKHKAQWRSTLETYAKPIWGMALDAIVIGDVADCIRPIWHEKHETARRVRQRIERVLLAAKVHDLRKGPNPANREDITVLLSKQTKKSERHPSVPWREMPAFMLKLRKLDSVSASALEFTILTAARSGETRDATWSEINLKARVWKIPGERIKAGKEHRVPLTKRAVAILKARKPGKDDALIFPGAAEGEPLSDAALLECLHGLRDDVTVHGFRRSFKNWVVAKLRIEDGDLLSELALAHTIKEKTKLAYLSEDALEARAPMMAAWSAFLG